MFMCVIVFLFFTQLRSTDTAASGPPLPLPPALPVSRRPRRGPRARQVGERGKRGLERLQRRAFLGRAHGFADARLRPARRDQGCDRGQAKSEEHTSELQSLMRNSYAVFCLIKKQTHQR